MKVAPRFRTRHDLERTSALKTIQCQRPAAADELIA